jgi:TonB-linked SusC/RagA family outer membrane protein
MHKKMTMNIKFLQLIVAILSLNLLSPIFSFAQDGQKTVTVEDENGNPIPGAIVLVGEGARSVLTNENGEFLMQTDSAVSIFIEAEGFESELIDAAGSFGLETVVLLKAPYQMGERDKVQMPFGIFNKRQIPGAVTVLSPREILKYDQTDFEGALNGRVPGMFGSSSIRGMGDPLVVIDGIPRPGSDLNLQQVEQITVLKDLSTSLMYGSQASNGVILVTTRRGEPLKKAIHFTAEAGFVNPISYPQYLNAADHMELYNEALANNGLAPKFSEDEISNTRSGIDPVRYPDESYYNSTYLNDWSTYYNVVGEASGGNEIAQYYLNLGWNRRNGLLKIGEGAKGKTDRFNMRGNINYNITRAIKLRFDGVAVFNISREPRYTDGDFWELSSTLHPEYYPVLVPASLITDPALLGAAKLVDGQYVLGGTSEYLTNIYGELTRNGHSQNNRRLLQMSTGLDFDLNSITRGLKASVYFSFDIFSQYTADLLNGYAVYSPDYSGDSVTVSKYGVDVKVNQQTITSSTYYRRIGIYGTLDYGRSFGDHEVKATGLAYTDQYSVENVLQPAKHLQFGLRANYVYKKKLIAELTGVMVGSTKLFETDPYAFSPGAGLGWIMTEESFLRDNPVINYLKIRANWAIGHTDESLADYYTGRDLYTGGSTFYYYQGTYSNDIQYLSNGNSELSWEKVMNINIGFESMLFDYKLGLEASYFNIKSDDQITPIPNSIPVYYTGLPYVNYGSDQIQGVEIGLNYRANIGDVGIRLGGNLVYSVPEVLALDELDYPDDYRHRVGKPTDAMFGFVALGLFKDQEDINNSPLQTFGVVQPGDIKYEDLNKDNVINNDDQMMIGNSGPRLGYGLTLHLNYKAFELFALGTGQTGQGIIFNDAYYWVYGDRKYSEVVLDRWTPSTASTAEYPRLSSTFNANNFMNSTFWLYDNNWFKLQTVQLTYTLQANKFAGLDEVRFFLRGHNLVTVSKIKDRTDLNIGSVPQTRGLSLGLSMLF